MNQLFETEEEQEHSTAATPLSEYSVLSESAISENAISAPLLIPLPNSDNLAVPVKVKRPAPATSTKQPLKFGLNIPDRPSSPALPTRRSLYRIDSYAEDLKTRPSAPGAAAYEAVPVSEFGAAMLRGMGWSGDDSERGASTDSRVSLRPDRLGLGSSQANGTTVRIRRPVEQSLGLEMTEEDEKRLLHPKRKPLKDDAKQPIIQRHSNVMIINGPHKDLIGVVSAFLQNGQVALHLLKSRQDILVGIKDIQPVDASLKQPRPTESSVVPSSNWLYPGLKVRIASKHSFERGRYYRQYGAIADVASPGFCTLRLLPSHQVLHNVPQSALETAIPRHADPHRATVRLVQAKDPSLLYNPFRILELDNNKHTAIIQWEDDLSIVLSVKYDDICEFVE